MSYNARVKSFVVTGATFETGGDKGCYVETGSADAPEVVDRMEDLPTGAVHDMDGSAPAALRPPVMWQNLIFQAANPNAHAQFKNLLKCNGREGVLTVEVPGAASMASQTVQARLRKISGSWEAPYRQGAFNTLVIRAEWRLKGLLTIS